MRLGTAIGLYVRYQAPPVCSLNVGGFANYWRTAQLIGDSTVWWIRSYSTISWCKSYNRHPLHLKIGRSRFLFFPHS